MLDTNASTKIFISYSRIDLSFAERLRNELIAKGFDAYLDKHDILPGEPWQERLANLIATADTIVFVVSPHSIASAICDWEINEAERLGKRILPVVVTPPDDDKVPGRLKRLNYTFLRNDEDWNTEFEKFALALLTDIDWIRDHTRFAALAANWQLRGGKFAFTLRSQELEDAESWLARRPASAPEPTALHVSFIQMSRRASTRRQRFWVAGSVAVTLITIALSALALLQKLEADTQRVEALANASLAERNAATAEANAKRAEVNAAEAKRSQSEAQSSEQRAVAELERSQRNESLTLAEQSLRETEAGDAVEGMRRALAAIPKDLSHPERPFVQRAELALSTAVLANRLVLALTPGGDNVNRATYSPDGKVIALATRDGVLALYDAESGRVRGTFRDDRGSILALAFSSDGRYVATSYGRQISIIVRELASGKIVKDLTGDLQSAPYHLLFLPDNNHLISVSNGPDTRPRIWELASGRTTGLLNNEVHPYSAVRHVSMSLDGRHLATSIFFNESAFFVWDVASRKVVFSNAEIIPLPLDDKSRVDFNPHEEAEGIHAVQFLPKSESIVLRGKRTIYTLDPGRRSIVAHWRFAEEWDASGPSLMEVAPDGRRVLVSSTKNDLAIHDLSDGRLSIHLRGHVSRLEVAAFSPDGRLVAAAGQDKSIRVWDAVTGRQLYVLRGHGERIDGLTYSLDGRRLLSHGDATARVWDLRPDAERLISMNIGKDWEYLRLDRSGARALAVRKSSSEGGVSDEPPRAIGLWHLGQNALLWEAPIAHDGALDVDRATFIEDRPIAAIWWNDGHLDLIDTNEGTQRRLELGKGREGALNSKATYSADGASVAIAWGDYGSDGSEGTSSVAVWSLGGPSRIFEITQAGYDPELVFPLDGKTLILTTALKEATVYGTQRVSIWSLASRTKLATFDRLMKGGADVLLAGATRWAALAGAAAPPLLIDLGSGKPLGDVAGRRLGAERIIMTTDMRHLLVKQDSTPWTSWALAGARKVAQFPSAAVATSHLTLSHNGKRLVTWSPIDSKRIEVFDLESGALIKDLGVHEANKEIYPGRTGRFVAMHVGTRTFQIVDTESNSQPHTIELDDSLHRWRFTAGDRRLVTADQSGNLRIWDTQTGASVGEMSGVDRSEPIGRGDDAGARLPILLADGGVRVVDTMIGSVVWARTGAEPAANCALSNDGRIVAYSVAGSIELGLVDSGSGLASIGLGGQIPSQLSFDEGSERLLVHAGRGRTSLVDLTDGRALVDSDKVDQAILVSQGLARLILAKGQIVTIFDARSGASIHRIALSQNVRNLVADATGETVAIVTFDAKVTVVDLASGKAIEVAALRQLPNWVGLSAIKGEIAIYEASGIVTLRRIRDGRVISDFPGDWTAANSFGSDWRTRTNSNGSHLAVRSPDNYVRFYRTKDGSQASYVLWDDKTIADVALASRNDIAIVLTEAGDVGFWHMEAGRSDHSIKLPGAFSRYESKLQLVGAGGQVLVTDESGGAHLISLNTFTATTFSTGRPEAGAAATMSANGTLLATLSKAGLVRVWHVALREVLVEGSLEWKKERSSARLRFSADGRRLVVEDLWEKPQVIDMPPVGVDLVNAARNTIGGLPSPARKTARSAQPLRLGIYMMTPVHGDADRLGLPQSAGALITEVLRDSRAAEAGLTVGDLIVEINGQTVANHIDASAAVRTSDTAADLKVTYYRDGQRRQLVATRLRKDEGPRNPFALPDVHDPYGGPTRAATAGIQLTGSADDTNAEMWVTTPTEGQDGSLDGIWFGRWSQGRGEATVKAVGDRLFVLYAETEGTYRGRRWLLEAVREENERLVGRWEEVGRPDNSGHYVGRIIGNERIDGTWGGNARWDFRRLIKR